jgi:hypothetical protein
MNCTKVQRRLLSQFDPERVPPSLRAHLEQCAACREYQHRLMQVEQHVARLVVPPASSAKERFLDDIRTKPTWGQPPVRRPLEGLTRLMPHVDRWRLAGLAAAVLLLVLAWKLIPGGGNLPIETKATGPDPLLARMQKYTLDIAETDQPELQVQALAEVADDLQGEAQKLAREPGNKESMNDLAEWYHNEVTVLVERAGAIPPKAGGKVLEPIAQRLARTAADADRLARETEGTPASAALTKLAHHARDARSKLEALSRPAGARLDLRTGAPVACAAASPRLVDALSLAPALLNVAGMLRADEPLPPGASDELRRFIRNKPLFSALVNGSVLLAKEKDVFKRAQLCTVVADCFVKEIQDAASKRDGPRAVELGQHLHDMLQRGVAANLDTVVNNTPAGSARDADFVKLSEDVAKAIVPLEEQLQSAGDAQTREYLQQTLRVVRDGRSEVAKALHGRGGKMNQAEIRRIN